MKPNQKSGLKNIEVPRDFRDWNNIPKSKNIIWETVTDPEKIEEILIDRNSQHLGQAQGTLFTTPEVIKLIGHDGCSEGADAVLQGTACLLYTSPSPRDLQGSRMPSSA